MKKLALLAAAAVLALPGTATAGDLVKLDCKGFAVPPDQYRNRDGDWVVDIIGIYWCNRKADEFLGVWRAEKWDGREWKPEGIPVVKTIPRKDDTVKVTVPCEPGEWRTYMSLHWWKGSQEVFKGYASPTVRITCDD